MMKGSFTQVWSTQRGYQAIPKNYFTKQAKAGLTSWDHSSGHSLFAIQGNFHI